MAPVTPPAPPDAGQGAPAPGAAGPEPPPGCVASARPAHAGNLGPAGAVGPWVSTGDETWAREPGLCRRPVVPPAQELPAGASRPAVSGSVGHRRLCSARDAARPQESPVSQGQQGTGDLATAAPVALFLGTDRGGGYTDRCHQGTRWERPGLGSADERASGGAGPRTPRPHTLAQAEQQEWGCCCRAPPEGPASGRAGAWQAGGWRGPGRAGGQCGQAPALTPGEGGQE